MKRSPSLSEIRDVVVVRGSLHFTGLGYATLAAHLDLTDPAKAAEIRAMAGKRLEAAKARLLARRAST